MGKPCIYSWVQPYHIPLNHRYPTNKKDHTKGHMPKFIQAFPSNRGHLTNHLRDACPQHLSRGKAKWGRKTVKMMNTIIQPTCYYLELKQFHWWRGRNLELKQVQLVHLIRIWANQLYTRSLPPRNQCTGCFVPSLNLGGINNQHVRDKLYYSPRARYVLGNHSRRTVLGCKLNKQTQVAMQLFWESI